MPVTIDDFGISPGRTLELIFPRTEEVRGSNPLTSTNATSETDSQPAAVGPDRPGEATSHGT